MFFNPENTRQVFLKRAAALSVLGGIGIGGLVGVHAMPGGQEIAAYGLLHKHVNLKALDALSSQRLTLKQIDTYDRSISKLVCDYTANLRQAATAVSDTSASFKAGQFIIKKRIGTIHYSAEIDSSGLHGDCSDTLQAAHIDKQATLITGQHEETKLDVRRGDDGEFTIEFAHNGNGKDSDVIYGAADISVARYTEPALKDFVDKTAAAFSQQLPVALLAAPAGH